MDQTNEMDVDDNIAVMNRNNNNNTVDLEVHQLEGMRTYIVKIHIYLLIVLYLQRIRNTTLIYEDLLSV